MTFQLTMMTREIASALALVAPVIDKSSAIPILKTTRITIANGIVEFIGTNTVQTIIARAACSGSGAIAIDAASLETKIRALRQSDPVTLTQDDGFVTVSQARTRWKTPCLPASDFPGQVADPVNGEVVKVGPEFMDALERAATCVDQNEPREYLRGVHLADVVVSTDGRSMAMLDGLAIMPGVTVPIAPIKAIASMKAATATVSESAIQFASEWITIKTQLVAGNYPQFRRVVPVDMPGVALVDRKEFMASASRASAIRADNEKSGSFIPLDIKIRDGEIELAATNREGEEGSDFVPCERQSGDDADIRVSGSLLIRAIQSLDCDTIRIEYRDHMSPVMISPVASDRENIRIVMPRQK